MATDEGDAKRAAQTVELLGVARLGTHQSALAQHRCRAHVVGLRCCQTKRVAPQALAQFAIAQQLVEFFVQLGRRAIVSCGFAFGKEFILLRGIARQHNASAAGNFEGAHVRTAKIFRVEHVERNRSLGHDVADRRSPDWLVDAMLTRSRAPLARPVAAPDRNRVFANRGNFGATRAAVMSPQTQRRELALHAAQCSPSLD